MTTSETDTGTVRTGTELAHWLLPLLKEYTDKLNAASDRLWAELLVPANNFPLLVAHAARLLTTQAALRKILLSYTRMASSLLDHYEFDDGELKLELTGRWEEAETAVRQGDSITKSVSAVAKGRAATKELAAALEELR